MPWKCKRQNPFDGKKHIALVSFEGDAPVIVGCLECDWREVVRDELFRDDDELEMRYLHKVGRCVAANQGGERCSAVAAREGVCHRHENRVEMWDRRYNAFRSPWSDISMPDAYREVFIRAIQDAELVADAQQVTRETFEEARRLRHASVVYFVERAGFIKIGTTTSLRSRLVSLAQGGCKMPEGVEAGPVKLLAFTPGDRRVESRYHLQFDKQRVEGEWFRPNKALLRLIEDLKRAEENGRKDILDQVIEAA